MDQLSITGSLSWQPDGAPLDTVNFLDSINYTTVVSIELTPDSPTTAFAVDGGELGMGGYVAAVYAEVYDKTVGFASSPTSGGGTPSSAGFFVMGAIAGSMGTGVPSENLVGRFLFTRPSDDGDAYPPGPSTTLMAFPSGSPTAKIWAFIRN